MVYGNNFGFNLKKDYGFNTTNDTNSSGAEALRSTIENLQAQKAQTQEDAKQVQEEKSVFLEENNTEAQEEQDLSLIQEQLSAAMNMYSGAQSQVLSAQGALNGAQSTLSSAQAALSSTPETIQQQDGVDEEGNPIMKEVPNPDYEAAKQAVEAAEAQVSEAQQALDSANEALTVAQEQIDSIQATLDQAEEEKPQEQDLQENLEAFDTEYEALQETIKEFDDLIEQAQAQFEESKQQLEKEKQAQEEQARLEEEKQKELETKEENKVTNGLFGAITGALGFLNNLVNNNENSDKKDSKSNEKENSQNQQNAVENNQTTQYSQTPSFGNPSTLVNKENQEEVGSANKTNDKCQDPNSAKDPIVFTFGEGDNAQEYVLVNDKNESGTTDELGELVGYNEADIETLKDVAEDEAMSWEELADKNYQLMDTNGNLITINDDFLKKHGINNASDIAFNTNGLKTSTEKGNETENENIDSNLDDNFQVKQTWGTDEELSKYLGYSQKDAIGKDVEFYEQKNKKYSEYFKINNNTSGENSAERLEVTLNGEYNNYPTYAWSYSTQLFGLDDAVNGNWDINNYNDPMYTSSYKMLQYVNQDELDAIGEGEAAKTLTAGETYQLPTKEDLNNMLNDENIPLSDKEKHYIEYVRDNLAQVKPEEEAEVGTSKQEEFTEPEELGCNPDEIFGFKYDETTKSAKIAGVELENVTPENIKELEEKEYVQLDDGTEITFKNGNYTVTQKDDNSNTIEHFYNTNDNIYTKYISDSENNASEVYLVEYNEDGEVSKYQDERMIYHEDGSRDREVRTNTGNYLIRETFDASKNRYENIPERYYDITGELEFKSLEYAKQGIVTHIDKGTTLANISPNVAPEVLAEYACSNSLVTNNTSGDNSKWLAQQLAIYAEKTAETGDYDTAISAIVRQLHDAMNGWGCDTDFVRELYTFMPREIRENVETKYNAEYADGKKYDNDSLECKINDQSSLGGLSVKKYEKLQELHDKNKNAATIDKPNPTSSSPKQEITEKEIAYKETFTREINGNPEEIYISYDGNQYYKDDNGNYKLVPQE